MKTLKKQGKGFDVKFSLLISEDIFAFTVSNIPKRYNDLIEAHYSERKSYIDSEIIKRFYLITNPEVEEFNKNGTFDINISDEAPGDYFKLGKNQIECGINITYDITNTKSIQLQDFCKFELTDEEYKFVCECFKKILNK